MTIVQLRPTFELQIAQPCEELTRRVGDELSLPEWRDTGLHFGSYAELHIPKAELRFWTPHLSLYFEGDQFETRIVGRFAPRQEIWTLVCVVYLALAFTAFFASMYTVALWSLGQFTWWGLVPPFAVAGIGVLYLVSRIGQRWSDDQMKSLYADWERLLEASIQKDSRRVT